jgi:hypothetical protein
MRRIVVPTLAGLIAGSLLTGCPDRSLSEVNPIQDHVHKASIPVNLNRNIDILFIVDNSGSMAEEQVSLTANFPQFINVLNTIPGGLPDVHLGIISTNVGTGGVNIGGCSSASRPQGDDGNLLTNGCTGLTGQFISDIKQPNGTRMTNYSGDLATLFTCMARLGTTGCGFEQSLDSMYRALQPGKNPGFIRQDAYLAIVFLGDEDDCSAKDGGAMFGDPNGTITSPLGPRTSFRCHEFGIECDNDPNPRSFGHRTGCVPRVNSQYEKDVQPYIDYVKSLKTNTKNIIVAGIIGNVDDQHSVDVIPDPDDATRPSVGPSCTSASGTAFPGFRIQAFLDAFPERNFTTTICNDNLTDAMQEIGNIIKVAVGSPCIDRALADRNPNIDGVQPECSVADVINPDDEPPTRVESIIPSCDGNGNTPPCWRFIQDAVQCPTPPYATDLAIDVNRGGASVPLGTVLEVQCVTN